MMRRLILVASGVLGVSSLFVMPVAHAATPTCFGKTATVVLTNGNDTWTAPDEKQYVVWAGGGDDRIWGPDIYTFGPAAGQPGVLICGGPGNDYLVGGNGNDKINGGDGTDHITDASGSDVLNGNAGDDNVDDKSCEDCDNGNDVVRGQGGNDILRNGWGHDKVYGGAGADTLYDTECDPTYLAGGSGDDYIESWSSSYAGWRGNVCDYAADTVNGGDGIDTAQDDVLDKVTYVEHLTRITQPAY